jgi:hypothetical protein
MGERRYRKMFILAVEGTKTEPQYFAIFNDENSFVRVNCLRGRHDSSPLHVLARMETHLKKEGLKKSDEAWLVVDRDQWTEEQLLQLHKWSLQAANYGFALSNPKFEFWLLLHFEDGDGVSSSQICSQKLERHLPGYDKGIDVRKITDTMIAHAIKRARQRDNPPCHNWPHTTGTTVYRLVERMLEKL